MILDVTGLNAESRTAMEAGIKQALAATGQGLLMQAYEQAFTERSQPVAQVLLTHADLSHRGRYLNVRNTILTLFEFGVVPIINENDTVSAEELRFSDNDTLGALIANMIGADMFIILTDVDCLYTGHPTEDPEARPVYTVAAITKDIERMAGHSGSQLGTGGMMAKIRAAQMVAACGGSSFIGPGRHPEILQALFSGELIGTFFLPGKAAPELVTRLNTALKAALASKDVVDGLATFGLEALSSSPAELSELIRKDTAKWAPIVKAIGFTADA